MELVQLDAAIDKHLKDGLKKTVRVENFPDDWTQLGRAVQSTMLYWGLKDEQYNEPQNFNPCAAKIQPGQVRIELLLRKKDLRTHATTLPIVQAVDELLSGFVPDPERPTEAFYQVSGGFVSVLEGIWGYAMLYAMPTRKVTRGF
ncbi:MAG: Gp37 family protein [Cyanobacteria bacterium J06638_20]